jgi:hypothetical protein
MSPDCALEFILYFVCILCVQSGVFAYAEAVYCVALKLCKDTEFHFGLNLA